MASFWGLHLVKGLRYSRVVEQAFHISSATLDLNSSYKDGGVISVLFEDGGKDYVLCNLSSKNGLLQVPLDLQFLEGDKISFSLRGADGDVFLTGYNVTDLTDMREIEDVSGEEEEEEEEIPQLIQMKRKRESSEGTKTALEIPPKKAKKENVAKKEVGKSAEAKPQKAQKKEKGQQLKLTASPTKKQQEPSQTIKTVQLSKTLNALMNGSTKEDTDDEDYDVDDLDLEEGEEEEEDDEGEEEEDEDDEEEDDDDDEEEEDDDDDDEEEEEEEEEEELFVKSKASPPKQSFPSSLEPPASAGKTPMVKGKKAKKELQQKLQQSPNLQKSPKGDKQKSQLNGGKVPASETPKSLKKKKIKENEKTPNTEKSGKALHAATPPSSKKLFKPGGVICEDLVEGTGPVAKKGKMMCVYYEGRLSNGKVFDKTTSGPAFKFRLGANEVIKGWDVAVEGMKVGGKRRITTPPAMAYGKRGAAPAIPPNAVLKFDVELKDIK